MHYFKYKTPQNDIKHLCAFLSTKVIFIFVQSCIYTREHVKIIILMIDIKT